MNTLTPEMHQDTNFTELYKSIEKHFKGDQTKEAFIPASKMDMPSEDILLENVTRLPSALFEKLVFKFNKSNSIRSRSCTTYTSH